VNSHPDATRQPRAFEGWSLLGFLLGLLLVALVSVAAMHPDTNGARMLIRITARSSLFFFLLAFTASASACLWPGLITQWQRRNRRYFGLAFAGSHLLHAGAIIAFARLDPEAFALATNRVTEFTGAIAYVFILAMAATSFGASAAWIGRRAWTILHTVGSYYIWISFAIAFGKRSLQGPVYPAAVCLLVVALGLRYGAALQRARRERSRGALG
jgi:DMSO/TMAO reductase YedYZ heme-binding membrane subunit